MQNEIDVFLELKQREKRMHYERSRRVDRYYPSFLSFLRTTVLRSQSVETIYDHRQRKGKPGGLFFSFGVISNF